MASATIKLHVTGREILLAEYEGGLRVLCDVSLDEVFASRAPAALVRRAAKHAPLQRGPWMARAPVARQEVWAAGVTYLRSKAARVEESKGAGGGAFYDRVYAAERPELFFKSAGWRVVGPRGQVRIRADSRWNVPEPELVLAINAQGKVFGYTIGNDMSSRSIEGENPLYLPQAKVYDGACALGPALLITAEPLPSETEIVLAIYRHNRVVFRGATHLGRIKRSFSDLAGWLYRATRFPHGAYLFTGVGIVPPDSFTLQRRDRISITIAPIGTLTNTVA